MEWVMTGDCKYNTEKTEKNRFQEFKIGFKYVFPVVVYLNNITSLMVFKTQDQLKVQQDKNKKTIVKVKTIVFVTIIHIMARMRRKNIAGKFYDVL